MSNLEIIITVAILPVLGLIGGGLKWMISGIISVVRDAIGEMAALRLEIREMRVEVRTFLGIRPPAEEEREQPLTPVTGVPIDPARGVHLTILRKGTEPKR